MNPDRSILHRLEQAGQRAPRLVLRGGERASGADRYEIVGKLAQGGVGEIFRGRDVDLGRDVALKILREDRKEDGELIRRFVEEAQIGGQLQHPGIVPVFELGLRDDRRPYFAMKLVKGETLAAILKRGDAPLDRLLGIFERVCQTIAYAHARHVVHRDLKPSNVMVGSFGEIQVLDWGFAKVLESGGVADERKADAPEVTRIATGRAPGSDSMAGSIMGTPAYMPPEQALGHVETLDRRSDVFSLGAMLCEILTGAPPYTDEALEQAARADLADAHARLDACGGPEEIVALCRRCLEPMRMDRPGDAGKVVDVVSAHLAEAEQRTHAAAVEAKRRAEEAESARVEARRQRRARGRTVLLGVALLVAGAAVLGGRLWYRGQQRENARLAGERIDEAYAAALGHFEKGEWEATRVDLARAKAVADAEGVSSERVARLLERTNGRLETALAGEARRAKRDAFLREIDRIRLNQFDPSGKPARDAQLEVAFRDFGIDISSGTPDDVAARLRETGLPLADVLTHWLSLRGDPTSPFSGRAKRLEEITNAFDPDPWRTKLRGALRDRDREALRALAEDREGATVSSVTLLAEGLARARDYDRAVELLEEALRREPRDFWLRYQLGWALTKTDRKRDAILHIDAAVALRPADAVVRANGARVLAESHPEEARRLWLGALRLEPESLRWMTGYSRFLRDRGELEAQIETWSRSDDLPAQLAFVNGRALQLRDDATERARLLVREHPESGSAHHLLAMLETNGILVHGEGWESVANHLVRARRLGVPLSRMTGEIAAALNFKASMESLDTVFRRLSVPRGSPEEVSILFQMSWKGYWIQPEFIERVLNRLVSVAPNYGRAWQYLASVQAKLGKTGESARSAETARKLGFAVTPNSLVEEARAHWGRGDFDVAAERLREAIALNVAPEWRTGHQDLLLLLGILGRQREAIRFYEQRVRGRGTGVDLLWSGRAYLIGTRREEALECFRKAARSELPGPLVPLLVDGLARCGARDLALSEIDGALARNPGDLQLRLRRNGVLVRLGRRPEALAEFERLKPSRPESVLAWVAQLGTLHRPDRARGLLRESDLPGPMKTIGEVFLTVPWLNMGEIRSSMAVLRGVRREAGLFRAMVDTLLGLALLHAGDDEGAAEALEAMADRQFPGVETLHALAVLGTGRIEEARELLRGQEKRALRNVWMVPNRGPAVIRAQIEQRAMISRLQDICADRIGTDAFRNATVHFFHRRYAESLPFFATCLEGPPSPTWNSFLGAPLLGARAAVRAGQPALARKWLRAGLSRWVRHEIGAGSPDAPGSSPVLAICLEHRDFEEARKSDDPEWRALWEDMRVALEKMRRPFWGDDYVIEREARD